MIFRAPASTANLGPGFDCAGCALDLWNELEVTDGAGVEIVGEGADELPRDETHMALQAFARLAPVEGRSFRFLNRIPLARGLGSSASAIALGLVAGATFAAREADSEELLGLGVDLEGHADNLAPALAGGACLTWEGHVRRVSDAIPFEAVAVVPDTRVETAASRAALPARVSHAAATFTAGRAALLGAGLASGDKDLLIAAFHDRLHEPYRAANAPLLEAIRADTPQTAVGVTLSGSGPSVIVWTRAGDAGRCAEELEAKFPDTSVLTLRVSALGAGLVA